MFPTGPVKLLGRSQVRPVLQTSVFGGPGCWNGFETTWEPSEQEWGGESIYTVQEVLVF